MLGIFMLRTVHFIFVYTFSHGNTIINRIYTTQEEYYLILQAELEDPTNCGYFPPYTYQKGMDMFFRCYPLTLDVVYQANITPATSINLTTWMEQYNLPFLTCYNLTEFCFQKLPSTNYTISESWTIEFIIDYNEYWGPLAAIRSDFKAVYFYNASKVLVLYCYFDLPIVA